MYERNIDISKMIVMIDNIEDITCPRVDTDFIFECSTPYPRTSEISS